MVYTVTRGTITTAYSISYLCLFTKGKQKKTTQAKGINFLREKIDNFIFERYRII